MFPYISSELFEGFWQFVEVTLFAGFSVGPVAIVTHNQVMQLWGGYLKWKKNKYIKKHKFEGWIKVGGCRGGGWNFGWSADILVIVVNVFPKLVELTPTFILYHFASML